MKTRNMEASKSINKSDDELTDEEEPKSFYCYICCK